jgi:hypothetical protein
MINMYNILEYLYMLIYCQALISLLNIYLYYVELNHIRYDIQLFW